MLKKLVAGALASGVAAGLLAVLLQFAFVQPLLLEAERFESGELEHFSMRVAHDHDHGAAAAATTGAADHDNADHDMGHTHDHGADDGALQRNALTVLFSVFTYVGFALMLVAAFQVAERYGAVITARVGLLWGLAGFVTFHLAPAFGLAPELPGNSAADITNRQVWWLATVLLSAGAMALLGYGRTWMHWGGGIVLLLLPHVIGAPHPGEYWGSAPPELASEFAVRAVTVSLCAWLALGLTAGYVWQSDKTA
jgi:cobalt transporter subunit CbtA